VNPTDELPEPDDAIEAMAARWLVQQGEGLTAEQKGEFARWRDADPRHAAAVVLLEETCGILSKLPLIAGSAGVPSAFEKNGRDACASGDTRDTRHTRDRKIISFSPALKSGLAIAACLTVAIAGWSLRDDRDTFTHTYVATDGYERVVLPDQSILELNAATEVRVRFSNATRRLALVRGEAYFTVAKNPARPFLVGANTVDVRAVGTAFNVRMEESRVEILVTEGRIQIHRAMPSTTTSSTASGATGATMITAGQRVSVSTNDQTSHFAPAIVTVESAAMRDALMWKAPRLVFVDTPLAEVIRQFNQQNRVQLEVGDPELARRLVGGTFRANQVESFVRLLEESRDITAERPDASRIVLRRVVSAAEPAR
jgi:transmembrane sensor